MYGISIKLFYSFILHLFFILLFIYLH